MWRLTPALILLAACDTKPAYHCDAIVTGTGTADGTYTCKVPPRAFYTRDTGLGTISGFASSPSGQSFSFSISTKGAPKPTTYTDLTLASDESYDVSILAKDSTPLWSASTGSGAFELTVTDLNAKASNYGMTDAWPALSGSLDATLTPAPSNSTTAKATVSMTFY
jgi:hypothetical protein